MLVYTVAEFGKPSTGDRTGSRFFVISQNIRYSSRLATGSQGSCWYALSLSTHNNRNSGEKGSLVGQAILTPQNAFSLHRPGDADRDLTFLQISFTVALGSLTYGYAAAILGNVSSSTLDKQSVLIHKLYVIETKIANTFRHQTLEKGLFYEYMKLDPVGPGKNHTDTIIAVWNTILHVGGIL